MQFYTVVACRRGDDDDDSEIWPTPEAWLEVEDDVMWAYYPFKNRQSCALRHVQTNDPLGGKVWDKYEVTSLYFPEVHTTSFNRAEKLCRGIEDRPVTDAETRKKLLRNAVLSFSVRHAVPELNGSPVSMAYIITVLIIGPLHGKLTVLPVVQHNQV